MVDGESIQIHLGHEEVVLRKRYEVLSIVNDILVGVWFLVGSFLFFGESTAYAGTWLFVIGSVELLIRPLIRLARHVHISRVTGTNSRSRTGLTARGSSESDQDF